MKPATAAIIVTADRVLSGAKPDSAGTLAKELLLAQGLEVTSHDVVAEGYARVAEALREQVQVGVDVIVVIGGTGVGPTNYTPEVTEEFIAARLHGLETQVLLKGLESSHKTGLSRGVIGMTDRGCGSLIINSASSRGAVADTLGVVLPLLGDIFRDAKSN